MKEDRALQLRPLTVRNAGQTVSGDKQLVAQAISHKLQPNQGWRHDDCMEPINGEIVDSLGPGKRASIVLDKAAIGGQFCDGPTGLNSSENVTMGVLQMFD